MTGWLYAKTWETDWPTPFETALKLADGLLITEDAENGTQTIFSQKFACPVSGFTILEIEPRLFSFNSPHGACPTCDGLGQRLYIDEALVVPDHNKSLKEGAIVPWSKNFAPFYMQALEGVAAHYDFRINTKWNALERKHQEIILYGSGKTKIPITYNTKTDSVWKSNKAFEGVIPSLERRMIETESNSASRGNNQIPNQGPLRFMPWIPPETTSPRRKNKRPSHQ